MTGRRLVLVGGGGHCMSVLDAALRMGIFQEIVITDAALRPGTGLMGCRVAGDDRILPKLYEEGFQEAFISIGSIRSTENRQEAYVKAAEAGFAFPNIIDPSAAVSAYACLGKGIFIGKNACVNAGADIGDMAIINTAAVIEHGCRIGVFAHVSVAACVCGDAQVGSHAFIGAGAVAIQGARIGMGSFIRAGTVVVKEVSGWEGH